MLRICIVICLLAWATCGYGQADSSRSAINFGIYPIIGYSPITKLQLGAISIVVFPDKVEDAYERPTTLSPYFIYTLNNQIITALKHQWFIGNNYILDGEIEFLNFPNSYYGIGSRTDPDVFERVRNRLINIEGTLHQIFDEKVFAGVRYDLQYDRISDIQDAGLLETDNPVGIHGGRHMGLGLSGRYDTRNNTLYPSAGSYFTGSIMFYGRYLGSEFTYTGYNLDFRKYMELFGPKNLLTFQVRTEFRTGPGIPFYALPQLGGDNRLRGIANANLYKDRQLIFAQLEGRQELFWRFGGVLFVGAGQVFNSLDRLNWSQTRLVYGLGGRFRALPNQKLNIRVDLGFTDNGQNAFYVSLGEAF